MWDNPGYDDWFAFRIGDSDMHRINCYSFYSLGKLLKQLEDTKERTADHLELFALSLRAEAALQRLLNSEIKLKQTELASRHVLKGLETINAHIEKEEQPSKHRKLGLAMALDGLRRNIEKMENVMAIELVMAPIYSVPPRGVFSTDSLLDSADDVFGEYKEKIPDDARADTKQAGRCLAFDLPTAAGFHIARATEAVMKKTMDAFGCPALKESQRNWGCYIKLLEQHGANKTLVHHLTQLRELHRNPLIHPEVTLTPLEAEQLWSLCTSAMLAMIGEIDSRLANQSV